MTVTGRFRVCRMACMNLFVLNKELTALALNYVQLCFSACMPNTFVLKHTWPRLATLNLLCVSGLICPVHLIMRLLQKHRLAIVQRDPGWVGPLLTDMVPSRLLNLIMLHCLGLLMQQLNMSVFLLDLVPVIVLCNAVFRLPLQKTPLFNISVYGLFVTNLLFNRNVRVRLLGVGRIPHENCILQRELLFRSCRKPGRLPGASTTRTLWTLVTTSISSGQQTTGHLL